MQIGFFFFFSLTAGCVGNVWCRHALSCFIQAWMASLHAVHFKKRSCQTMALCRRWSIWLCCTEDPKLSLSGLRSSFWLLHEHRHFNAASFLTGPHQMGHHNKGWEAAASATAPVFTKNYHPNTSIVLVFPWFKEGKQNREGCHFSLLKGLGLKKKSDTICFPTVDGHSRLTLLGFRHSSKATFLSSR